MSFNADAFTLTLLGLLAAVVLGIIAYAVSVKLAARRKQREIVLIRATIIDYFRRSGVTVSADCFDGNGIYTAVVESEPMKRFRLSHIIEMTIREHVRKASGLELDKVYWRFPIKEATQAVAMPGATGDEVAETRVGDGKDEGVATRPDDSSDEYINEGLENYRHIPKPEVTELSWETFEEVSTIGRDKKE